VQLVLAGVRTSNPYYSPLPLFQPLSGVARPNPPPRPCPNPQYSP
jgi:hypothetical protein